jgi:hypothetical protein
MLWDFSDVEKGSRCQGRVEQALLVPLGRSSSRSALLLRLRMRKREIRRSRYQRQSAGESQIVLTVMMPCNEEAANGSAVIDARWMYSRPAARSSANSACARLIIAEDTPTHEAVEA